MPLEAMGAPYAAAFKSGMHDLGWLEGTSVEYRVARANGDMKRLDVLAGELAAQKVDVIVVSSSQAQAVQRATTSIPVVMVFISNPVGNGFVASLARPGGNITGIATLLEDATAKLVQILHEVVPQARRIAYLQNESNPSHALYWDAFQMSCAAQDLVVIGVVANTPIQLGAAVEHIVREQAQAVVVAGDAMFFNERSNVQKLLRTTRLPVACQFREEVVAGGLLSYSSDLVASFHDAAKFVDKILRGAQPADLPVEQPTKFELVINLRTAKALGITIPQSVLLRSDEVIQ